MTARGALIKPWIFREVAEGYRDLTADERLAIYRRYVALALEHWRDDERGRANVRDFTVWHLNFWCRYAPRHADGSWPTHAGARNGGLGLDATRSPARAHRRRGARVDCRAAGRGRRPGPRRGAPGRWQRPSIALSLAWPADLRRCRRLTSPASSRSAALLSLIGSAVRIGSDAPRMTIDSLSPTPSETENGPRRKPSARSAGGPCARLWRALDTSPSITWPSCAPTRP